MKKLKLFQRQKFELKDRNRLVFDFDGVIHSYKYGFCDGKIYGEPMKDAFKSIIKLQSDGYKIIISTARPNWKEIPKWLSKHGMPKDNIKKIEITDKKVYGRAYIDDRAIRFTNWKDILNYFR